MSAVQRMTRKTSCGLFGILPHARREAENFGTVLLLVTSTACWRQIWSVEVVGVAVHMTGRKLQQGLGVVHPS